MSRLTGGPADEQTRGLVIEVRADRCCSSGNCVLIAPQVFDQDEQMGVVVVLDPEPPAGLHGAVREAADICPVRAITVRDR